MTLQDPNGPPRDTPPRRTKYTKDFAGDARAGWPATTTGILAIKRLKIDRTPKTALSTWYLRFQELMGQPFPVAPKDKKKVYEVLVNMSSAARNVIISYSDDVCLGNVDAAKDPEVMVNTFYRALIRTIGLLVNSLDCLLLDDSNAMDEIGTECTTVCYAMISLFRSLLAKLTSCASSLAADETQGGLDPEGAAYRDHNIRAKAAVKLKALLLKRIQLLANTYIVLLCDRGAGAFAPTTKLRDNILEGMMYLLLTRAGQLLYTMTFGQARRDTIAEEMSPGEISEGEERGAQIEGEHLVPLVQRALTDSVAAWAKARSPSRRKEMVEIAKEKLQNTLVKAAFGDGCPGLETIRDVPLVALSIEPVDLPRPKGGHPDNEFMRMMWEICGWEILGRKLPGPD
ncbi:MAG: hypothetical protein M1828_000716 [Chrysothrix sp. TS-e1954]|nr:MAG: hypothetical protein M1828_000716 [Chrysothrix sp. TS-e1954]